MSDIPNRSVNKGGAPQRPRPRRRPHIDLGDTRSESFGEWLYGHRVGIITVIIATLLGGAYIATARVDVEVRPIEYIIEFTDEVPTPEDIERLKQERDRLQEDIDRRMAAVQNVKNHQSNEAAEEGGQESQNYDSETQQMMDKVASDMASNRSDYESGMRDVQGIGKGGTGSGSGGKKGDGKDNNFKGAVTVEYDISYVKDGKKIARHADGRLYTPAYRSKGGGVVVVEVKVNRNGSVISAVVRESTNRELNNIALEAAKHHLTKFRIDDNAPQSNVGTITYTFLAQ